MQSIRLDIKRFAIATERLISNSNIKIEVFENQSDLRILCLGIKINFQLGEDYYKPPKAISIGLNWSHR